jgi:aryl-alcohol dehydrogenase-like predicted oxidoreductase
LIISICILSPDIDTPIEETVRAIHTLIEQGKVIYWGTSEWSAQQITKLTCAFTIANGLTAPTMEQPQYNLLHRDIKVEIFYRFMKRAPPSGHPRRWYVNRRKYNDGIPDDRLALPEL